MVSVFPCSRFLYVSLRFFCVYADTWGASLWNLACGTWSVEPQLVEPQLVEPQPVEPQLVDPPARGPPSL